MSRRTKLSGEPVRKLTAEATVPARSPARRNAARTPHPAVPRLSTRASATLPPCRRGPTRGPCLPARLSGRRSGSLFEERLQRGAEVRSRAAHRVHVGSQPDPLFEAHAVELVELLFGECQRGRAGGGQGAQHLAHLVLEIRVLVYARHEPQPRRLRGAEDPSRGREIECDLLARRALEQGHDDRRDDAHGGVEIGLVQQGEQGVDQRSVDRILLLRPVERRRENAAFQRSQHPIAHLGSSSSRRRSAVENTFPWASVLSEMVPPPSSAPCSRKFRAWRLGSSYRSTGPEIMPLKCRATRAAVTCFTRIG